MPPPPPPPELWLWVCLGFPLSFFTLWTLVATILTWASGLTRLRRLHPPNDERLAPSFSWASGRVGGVSYRNCLVVGLGERGLHVGPNLLFRPVFLRGLPCVPWEELELVEEARPALSLLAFLSSGGVRVRARTGGVELLLYGEAGRAVARRLGVPGPGAGLP